MKTLLMTLHDAAMIAKGSDLSIGTIDDESFNVRGPELRADAGDNPSGLPRVQLGYDQLRLIITGHTVYGFVEPPESPADWIEQIAARLITLEEYRELLGTYHAQSKAAGQYCPPIPADEEILPLITPVTSL